MDFEGKVKYMKSMKEDDKYKKLFNFFSRWVRLNEEGMTVGLFLKSRNIQNAAIYGMGALGRHLLFELREAGINVVYGIDQRSDKLNLDISFLNWADKEALPDIDMLIVTAIVDYDVIERELCEVREYPVISLEDIIKDMEKQRSNR